MAGAMPQNHHRALREQRPLSTRARWLFALAGGIVVAAVVVLVLAGHGTRPQRGCVHTTLAGVIGAQTYDECGPEARRTCARVRESRREFGTVGVLIVARACRQGGLPVS